MSDKFSAYSASLTSPAERLTEITPDDATDLPEVARAINVATSGAVRVTTIGGTTATVYIAAGVAFPVRALRIWASGTAATGIVAMS